MEEPQVYDVVVTYIPSQRQVEEKDDQPRVVAEERILANNVQQALLAVNLKPEDRARLTQLRADVRAFRG